MKNTKSGSEEKGLIPVFPNEIWYLILFKMPIKYLANGSFSLVCKYFYYQVNRILFDVTKTNYDLYFDTSQKWVAKAAIVNVDASFLSLRGWWNFKQKVDDQRTRKLIITISQSNLNSYIRWINLANSPNHSLMIKEDLEDANLLYSLDYNKVGLFGIEMKNNLNKDILVNNLLKKNKVAVLSLTNCWNHQTLPLNVNLPSSFSNLLKNISKASKLKNLSCVGSFTLYPANDNLRMSALLKAIMPLKLYDLNISEKFSICNQVVADDLITYLTTSGSVKQLNISRVFQAPILSYFLDKLRQVKGLEKIELSAQSLDIEDSKLANAIAGYLVDVQCQSLVMNGSGIGIAKRRNFVNLITQMIEKKADLTEICIQHCFFSYQDITNIADAIQDSQPRKLALNIYITIPGMIPNYEVIKLVKLFANNSKDKNVTVDFNDKMLNEMFLSAAQYKVPLL